MYLILLSETVKTFVVKELPAFYAEQSASDAADKYMDRYAAYTMRKDTFCENIVRPLTTIDFSK